jgi:hypothetical protein
MSSITSAQKAGSACLMLILLAIAMAGCTQPGVPVTGAGSNAPDASS